MKLIRGRKQEAEARAAARRRAVTVRWFHIFLDTSRAATAAGTQERDFLKILVAGVKFFARDPDGREFARIMENRMTAREMHAERFKLLVCIRDALYCMTPREIETTFPAEKTYDGRGEWKDYFTSMEAMRRLPPAPPYWKDRHDFSMWLPDWYNRDILNFCIAMFMATSQMRRDEGKGGLMEAFIERQQGRPPRCVCQ